MQFEIATATRIIFGAGKLSEVGSLAKKFGQHALVVTGSDVRRAQRLTTLLQDRGVSTVTFSVSGEPEIDDVERGIARAKLEKCEFVIGFGGGSALDTGKAIAAMLANEGSLMDYLEVIGGGKALSKPSLPFIAIPTTAGTGSEVTRNAVLASPEHRAKVSLRSVLMLPRIALVDPQLAWDLPPIITASSGLDALTQVIEPYVCTKANPITDAICVDGMRRVARSLRVAYKNGRAASAREDMAVASLFGGLALANAGLGAVHGFAGPIGGMFAAPHGAVCAALLPHVIDANLRALRQRSTANDALRRYDEVARALTGVANASADEGLEWVRKLVADLRIPPLGSYGIKNEHTAQLVEKAAKSSSMKANPIVLTETELAEVLRRAL